MAQLRQRAVLRDFKRLQRLEAVLADPLHVGLDDPQIGLLAVERLHEGLAVIESLLPVLPPGVSGPADARVVVVDDFRRPEVVGRGARASGPRLPARRSPRTAVGLEVRVQPGVVVVRVGERHARQAGAGVAVPRSQPVDVLRRAARIAVVVETEVQVRGEAFQSDPRAGLQQVEELARPLVGQLLELLHAEPVVVLSPGQGRLFPEVPLRERPAGGVGGTGGDAGPLVSGLPADRVVALVELEPAATLQGGHQDVVGVENLFGRLLDEGVELGTLQCRTGVNVRVSQGTLLSCIVA